MRRYLLGALVVMLCSIAASAQTVDELLAKYVKTIGGMDKIAAIKSMRSTGKFDGGGGFQAVVIQENKRPSSVREDFLIQGFTATSAYDGRSGWKVNPFSGKKDAETLGEEELKSIVEDSDFDGPLINYKEKGNKIEFVDKEDFEGSDVYKLKVTLANGTLKWYYLDADFYVPIKIETKHITRGTEIDSETILGDYKEAAGVFFPFSYQSGAKGSSNKSTITYDKIEINPTLDDSRFVMPAKK